MYSGAFLFLVLFNVPVMSFTGLQVFLCFVIKLIKVRMKQLNIRSVLVQLKYWLQFNNCLYYFTNAFFRHLIFFDQSNIDLRVPTWVFCWFNCIFMSVTKLVIYYASWFFWIKMIVRFSGIWTNRQRLFDKRCSLSANCYISFLSASFRKDSLTIVFGFSKVCEFIYVSPNWALKGRLWYTYLPVQHQDTMVHDVYENTKTYKLHDVEK